MFVIALYSLLLLFTFDDIRDAEDAIYHMNHSRFAGREITVEFTRGTRKSALGLISSRCVVLCFRLVIFSGNHESAFD